MDQLFCSVNQKHGNFSRSDRKHGRCGRMFVVCGYCGEELQATEYGVFDTNPAKNRIDPVKTKLVSLRLTEDDWKRWKESGFPSSLIFKIGLSNVLQKPYKP